MKHALELDVARAVSVDRFVSLHRSVQRYDVESIFSSPEPKAHR